MALAVTAPGVGELEQAGRRVDVEPLSRGRESERDGERRACGVACSELLHVFLARVALGVRADEDDLAARHAPRGDVPEALRERAEQEAHVRVVHHREVDPDADRSGRRQVAGGEREDLVREHPGGRDVRRPRRAHHDDVVGVLLDEEVVPPVRDDVPIGVGEQLGLRNGGSPRGRPGSARPIRPTPPAARRASGRPPIQPDAEHRPRGPKARGEVRELTEEAEGDVVAGLGFAVQEVVAVAGGPRG
jgi:hypothetical protein